MNQVTNFNNWTGLRRIYDVTHMYFTLNIKGLVVQLFLRDDWLTIYSAACSVWSSATVEISGDSLQYIPADTGLFFFFFVVNHTLRLTDRLHVSWLGGEVTVFFCATHQAWGLTCASQSVEVAAHSPAVVISHWGLSLNNGYFIRYTQQT